MIIKGLSINETTYPLQDGKKGKLAVFIYSGLGDPRANLDYAVQEYVKDQPYHELIDAQLDNPWMRVVLSNINGIKQEKFNPDKHNLNKLNREEKLKRILKCKPN